MAQVILVNKNDHPIGRAEKLEAHQKGLMHRAFSVFLMHDEQILIQRRAVEKYHCGGLWSNTCCSHPMPGETVEEAGERRLWEELGIGWARLKEIGHVCYRISCPNGLIEHEYDHILLGRWEGQCKPNPTEVSETQWVPVSNLCQYLRAEPELFTPWLHPCLRIVLRELRRDAARLITDAGQKYFEEEL